MMQVLKIGPIFTTWMVHFFTGKLSNFVAPTRQFFGMSHLSMAELRPVQSAITDIPLICVNGSLSNTCIQMSSTNDASQNWVFGATFPVFEVNEIRLEIGNGIKETWRAVSRWTYLVWPQKRFAHFCHAYRPPCVYSNSVNQRIRICFLWHALVDYRAMKWNRKRKMCWYFFLQCHNSLFHSLLTLIL